MIQEHLEAVAIALHEASCITFGNFILRSGEKSTYYIDLGQLISHPPQKKIVVEAYAKLYQKLNFDLLSGIPDRITPIAASVADKLEKPQIVPRMKEKLYGKKDPIIGSYKTGDVVGLMDDVITSGGSFVEAISYITEQGLTVRDLVALVDREEGGVTRLQESGFNVHTFTTISELVKIYQETGLVKETHLLSETLKQISLAKRGLGA